MSLVKEGEGLQLVLCKFMKYVDYNFSVMIDIKGGFLSIEDDFWNKSMFVGVLGKFEVEQKLVNMIVVEWERLQLIKKLQRNKLGFFEFGLSVLVDEKMRK